MFTANHASRGMSTSPSASILTNFRWCSAFPRLSGSLRSSIPRHLLAQPWCCHVRTPLLKSGSSWWPAHYDNAQFGYSVFGTTTLTDAAPFPAGTNSPMQRLASTNPLRRGATIAFALAQGGKVRAEVFDVAGRRVRVLHDGELIPGHHEWPWNGLSDGGSSVAAGLYVIRVETEAGVATRKLVVLE